MSAIKKSILWDLLGKEACMVCCMLHGGTVELWNDSLRVDFDQKNLEIWMLNYTN